MKRCQHSMMPGLCVVAACANFDGITKTSGPIPTLRTCRHCGHILRGRGTAEVCMPCQSKAATKAEEARDAF